MLIMLAALARVEGNASFSEHYWPQLKKWAEYLKAKGLDPENQLSTDDFAGHLAHNANLSIKAILALASYGRLAEMTGRKEEGAEYLKTARDFAKQWITLAAEGDRYKLAFDAGGRKRQHADPGGGTRARPTATPNSRRSTGRCSPSGPSILREKGLDPENQLCTDDFAGHLAHNANLSDEGHHGTRRLSDAGRDDRPQSEAADLSRDRRRTMAHKWIKMAADGDHYRAGVRQARYLEPEIQSGLGPPARLESFPAGNRAKGDRVLQDQAERYGLPLDNRKAYTKLDWMLWTATLADNRADFEALIAPAYSLLNESPSRVPLTDWY